MKGKKTEQTVEEWLAEQLESARKFMVPGYELTLKVDGDWTWNESVKTIAHTIPRANYKSATITFHRRALKEMTRQQLCETLIHEVVHVLLCGLRRQHDDTVEVLLDALKNALKNRFNNEEEKATVVLERLLSNKVNLV